MQSILEFKNVSMAYHSMDGEIPAVSNISFEVSEGEFVAIVGPSGCGKSTILNLISGLLKPESGEILIKNSLIQDTTLPIGYMLQKDHLFEWRSVYRNILLGLEIKKKLEPEPLEKVERLITDYGLKEFKQVKPSQLSGGMRQRAALIRTLALEPELLLLDEPFSALDYQTRLNVSDDIYNIIKKENKTAILVTHDISEAISIADWVIVLTRSPASIKKTIPIQLNITDRTPMKSRNAPEFKNLFNEIWKELNQYG